MQRQIDRHSRLVAWAKIILPIIALGLLSTLFLLSKSVDPIATIPFSDADLDERTRGQQISAPEVFGVTSGGDLVSLKADFARQSEELSGVTIAAEVTAEIKLASGTLAQMRAGEAAYNGEAKTIALSKGASFQTSLGYSVETDALDLNLAELLVVSQGPIKGNGPATTLEAGKMRLERPASEKDAHLLFSDGVKLVYRPQKAED